jgi:DNA repair protein RadA/Sms
LKEAAKLGFQRAFLPDPGRSDAPSDAGLAITTHGNLASLVADIAALGGKRRTRKEA